MVWCLLTLTRGQHGRRRLRRARHALYPHLNGCAPREMIDSNEQCVVSVRTSVSTRRSGVKTLGERRERGSPTAARMRQSTQCALSPDVESNERRCTTTRHAVHLCPVCSCTRRFHGPTTRAIATAINCINWESNAVILLLLSCPHASALQSRILYGRPLLLPSGLPRRTCRRVERLHRVCDFSPRRRRRGAPFERAVCRSILD